MVTHKKPVSYLCLKFNAFFISEIELLSSVRSDFMELAFISEVAMCWSLCDELCALWVDAWALLDI